MLTGDMTAPASGRGGIVRLVIGHLLNGDTTGRGMRSRDDISRDDALTRVELARLEGTVSTLVETVKAEAAARASAFADIEQRMRKVERWQYSMPLSSLGAIAALLISIFHH